MLPFCKSISIAFGVDTDFFKPDPQEQKIFDVSYIATWSEGWKRQALFGEATKGLRACAVGSLQPDGLGGLQKCNENGVYTLVGLLPAQLVSKLYQMSRVCAITSWHGSERSMLESLSCNVPLVLTKDNELGVSLVGDHAIVVEPNPVAIRAGIEMALKKENVNTRDWVIKNYSAEKYAEKILEVIDK